MNIATYKAAIKTWVENQGGGGITAQWRDEKGGWQSKTRARLHLQNSRPMGVEHLRHEVDADLADGVDLVPTVSGDRQITLVLLVESRDQSGSNTAMWHLEKLRTSLRKPSVRAALYAAGLAHSTSETVQDLDSWVDDRVESMASLDVHFNAVVNERDEDEGGSYVDTADIAATLETPAGDDAGWAEKEFP